MLNIVEFSPEALLPCESDREPLDPSMLRDVLEYVVAPYVVNMYNAEHQVGAVENGMPLSEVEGDLYILAVGNCCYRGDEPSFDMNEYPMATNGYIKDDASDVVTIGTTIVDFVLTRKQVIQVLHLFLNECTMSGFTGDVGDERMSEILYVLESMTV